MTIIDQAKQVLAILLSYAIVLAQLAPLEAQSQNVLPNSATASRTTSSMEGLGGSTFDTAAAFQERNSEASAAPKPSNMEQQGQPQAPSAFTVSPASLTFSAQLIGTTSAAKAVTISNTGASAQPIVITMTGDYTETDNCNGSVAASGSCTAQITFAPTIVGSIKGAATVNDNSNNLLAFVDITGAGQAPVTTAPTSLAFTGGTIGTISAAKTFKITNNTTSSVTINSITTNVPDYTINTGTCLTAPLPSKGKFCTVTVQVTPSSAADDGAIIVTDNAPNALPLVVKLTSAATAGSSPISLSKTSLIFKTLSGGTSAAQTITVTNTSASTVTLGTITASADYTILNNTCTASLAASAKCTFGIEFQPTFVGKIEGSAAVPVNAPNNNSPQVVNLTGTSEAPLTVAPASLTFASQAIDSTSTAKPVKITNNSASAVTLSSVVPSGDFQIQPSGTTCSLTGGTLLAGQICTIEVQFSPTIAGSALGALTVANNASPNPLIISLAGTGAGNGFTLSALPSKFNVTQGSNGASTITVADVGSFTGSVSLTASGLPSGVTAVFNPSSTTGSSTLTLTASSSATTGAATVTVTGTSTSLTQTAKINLSVVGGGPPPTITGFSPGSGPEGTPVALSGTNFTGGGSATPVVTLAHQGGGSLSAPVSNFTATSINFVIPSGAATGDITVTVGSQNATSTTALAVTTPSNFTVGVAPASGSVIQGQSTTFSVTLNSSNGFTGLSALSVTGLPGSVTASFNPASISVNQTSIMTLSAPMSQATGTSSLSVTASATIGGQSVTQSATVSLQVNGISTTFLGRTVVDDSTQTPIGGVLVTFLGKDDKGNITGCTAQTSSDASGNFVLPNLPAACVGPQLIAYNGLTATSPAGKFAGVNLSYTIVANQVTTSPVLIHLPRIDNAEINYITQNANVDQVFTFQTDPRIVVTVYAKTTFILDDGSMPNPFPLVAVEVPVDRLPDNMPSNGMVMPFIVAFQPANATASQPVAVDFPNLLNIPPGGSATLMTLDPTHGYMVSYGTGSVSPDASRIVPDADPGFPGHLYGLVHFDWHGPTAPPPPPTGPGPCGSTCCAGGAGGAGGGGGPEGGDPVDLSSGLQVVRATDIVLNGERGSISFNRVFRSMDTNAGPFGIGTNNNYSHLLNVANFFRGTCKCITLVMPDGNQFLFTQTGTNTFTNATVPSLIGSQITIPSSGTYSLRWKDGSVYQFTSIGGPLLAYLTSIADRNGNTTTLVRGNSSQPSQITQIVDPVGRALTLTYDSSNRITQISDPISRTAQYTYNAQGMLATVTNAAGGVTTYAYDTSNNLIKTTDARGVVVMQDTYDSNGRVIQQIQADGGVINFAYTLLNSLVPTSPVLQTVVTDALGNQTTYRFDPTQNLLSVTDPTGQVRVFTHSLQQNNLVTSITGGGTCPVCQNPGAGDITFTYDSMGNILTRTDSLGGTTTYTYDPVFGQITSTTDPLGNVYKNTYDASGNKLSSTDPDGNTTTYTYNSFGQLVQQTDALGGKTTHTYDSFGNEVSSTNALGNTRTYVYDAVSRFIQGTDPLGRTTTLTYDALDRLLSRKDALGHTSAATYDPIGNITSFTDESGNKSTYTFNAMGRLQSKTDPRGKAETYTYDFDGNVVKFVDRIGQTSTFSFDALNRLNKESYQDGSTVKRSLDARGRLLEVIDSAGGTFDFAYDADGRMTSSSTPFGTTQYSYDAAGKVTSSQVSGQAAVTYTYDAAGNVLNASQATTSAALTYDARNRLSSITRPNSVSSQYSYDAMRDLLSLTHSGGQSVQFPLKYTYDAVNNRSTYTSNFSQPQPVTNSFDTNNRLTSGGGTSYTYDDNGALTSSTDSTGTTNYTWDPRHRLNSISAPNGQKTTFLYDFEGNLIQQTDAGPTLNLTQSFVLDDLTNVAYVSRSNGDSVSVLAGRSIDQDLAVTHASGNVEYKLGDAMNSTQATVDQNGNLVSSFAYDPFGKTTTTSTYPFQYTGRVPVSPSLYYYRARYYCPAVGRFISEDPLGQISGDSLLYRYGANNPVNHTDPSGLLTNCTKCAITGIWATAIVCTAVAVGVGVATGGVGFVAIVTSAGFGGAALVCAPIAGTIAAIACDGCDQPEPKPTPPAQCHVPFNPNFNNHGPCPNCHY
jgi:RHS repeat-associated protein